MRRTLLAAAATRAEPVGRTAAAAVLRWQGSEAPPRVVVRRLARADPAPPAYRAVLLALWEARRLRARAVVLFTDDAGVASQVSGTQAPPEGALGPYLQIRALMHAFRWVEIRHPVPACDRDAIAAARTPVSTVSHREKPGSGLFTDLPLWAAAS